VAKEQRENRTFDVSGPGNNCI